MINRTPSGDEIDTYTIWLTFPEGEIGLSLDLTRFNAAMKGLRASLERHADPCGGNTKGGEGCTCDPGF